MSKVVYVGPTIPGVASRNTVYNTVPQTVNEAAREAPYLLSLCVPIEDLPDALRQIRNQSGSIYSFYRKALTSQAK